MQMPFLQVICCRNRTQAVQRRHNLALAICCVVSIVGVLFNFGESSVMQKLLSIVKLAGLAIVLAAFTMPASEASAQGARIQLTITKAGFVVGVSSGSGTLFFNNRAYPVTVAGLRIGLTIGASNATLSGPVQNLRKVSDIEGTYGTVGASAAAVAGGDNLVVQNNKGVKLVLRGTQRGLEASLDAGGLTIRLQR